MTSVGELAKQTEEATKTDVEKAVTKERERILTQILKSSQDMALDYKNTIKHAGSLLTGSMTFAYSKGINDVLKLIAKGATNNGQN